MKSGEQQSECKAHSKPHGCAKRGGRPVTWIGGGGLDPKKLAGLGVPSLRELFSQVFGENTASNNAGWLRRKLAESPDSVHGQRRSLVVRARDMGAAIWNNPIITPGEPGQAPEEHAAETASVGDGEGLGGSCEESGGTQLKAMEVTEVSCQVQLGRSSTDASVTVLHGNSSHHHHHHHHQRGVKRSCTEASATLAQKASALRCHSPSGSGSGLATGTHLDGSVSPRAHHKSHHHHHNHSQRASSGTSKQHSPAAGGASGVGMVIMPESFTDSYCGLKVMVYWPADKKWWEATICGLKTSIQHLQLLYSDLTEESIIGHDFTELLRKGHLALACGQAPPASTGMAVGSPAAAALHSSVPVSASGLAPCVPAVNLGLPSMAYTRRAQSCVLPSSICADSTASYQDFNRSASTNFCARMSTTGSGSASGGEIVLGEAVKRRCYEESNNSNSNGSNSAGITAITLGVASSGYANVAEQHQQQHQGSDATTQLELWFASQQRQQQQLQLQMQANMQMQQQVQMQMQQQMVVHMSMQQAAGQYMHMQAPALSAPVAPTATATIMPSTVTAGVQVPGLQSSVAGVASFNRSSAGSPSAAPAAMTASTTAGCLQNAAPASNNGAWGVWQSACAPASAAAGTCGPAGMQQQLQQQQIVGSGAACTLTSGGCASAARQQQWSLPPVQLPGCCSIPVSSSNTSPRACDHVVPELNAKLASASIANTVAWQAAHPQQQAQQGAAAAANCMLVPGAEGGYININLKADQLASCRTNSGLQAIAGDSGEDRVAAAAAGDVIATLLSRAGEDLFGLDQLEQDDGAMQQSLAGAAAALDEDFDGCDDGMCCDGCSSGGNSSLCESVADELAVAGLDADDAPGYYMFGGAGSPRQQSVQQDGSFSQQAAEAYAQQCNDVEAEMTLEACYGGVGSGAGDFAGDAGFQMANEPCENSFAHMFDFD